MKKSIEKNNKKNEIVKKESDALSFLPSVIPAAEVATVNESLFLPSIRVDKKEYTLNLWESGKVTQLEDTTLFSLALVREFFRKLENKSYTKRIYDVVFEDKENESYKEFKRVREEKMKNPSSNPEWMGGVLEEAENEKGEKITVKDDRAFTLLVVVFHEDRAILATWEVAGPDVSYFLRKILQYGIAKEGKGILLQCHHGNNVKISKSGNAYLNSWKVTEGRDFEIVDLTDEQNEQIKTASKVQKNQLEYWFNS